MPQWIYYSSFPLQTTEVQLTYRVIHKSVKHFKNSQHIYYAMDHGNSYANRKRNSSSIFYIFIDGQCVHLW
jgi:hypothetical protein